MEYENTLSVRYASLIFALIATLFSTHAWGGSTPATVSISANVPAECAVTGTAIAFGNYVSSPVDQNASIGVLCTNGTSYTLAMDAGSGSGATVASRVMSGPAGSTLNYSLYGDAAHTTVWGHTAGAIRSGVGNGILQSLQIYGRIPGSQTTAPGIYTDTVTATLTY